MTDMLTLEAATPRASHETEPRPRLQAVTLCRECCTRHGSPDIRRQVRASAGAISSEADACTTAHTAAHRDDGYGPAGGHSGR